MFKDVDIVLIFLRNRVIRLKQKHHWPSLMSTFFKQLTGTVPGDVSRRSILLFQALRHGQFLHIAFARDVDIDCGKLLSHEPQT